MSAFTDPVTLTACGHTLCRGCYTRWAAYAHASCPECRAPLPPECPAVNIVVRDLMAAVARTAPAMEAGGGSSAATAPALEAGALYPGWTGGALVGRCVAQLNHEGNVYGLAMVGEQLVSGGLNNHLRVWDPRTGQTVASMVGMGSSIAALPGGRFATAPGDGPTAEVWDAATATRICKLEGHTRTVYCVAPLPGDLVATGGRDLVVRIWRAATGTHVAALEGHTDWLRALAMLPDGRLASGCMDNTVRLWDLSTRLCTAVLHHAKEVYALAALEGGCLASG